MRTARILALAACLYTSGAVADVLCLKNSRAVVRGRVTLSDALKVVSSRCPIGYRVLLNTNKFQGPQGEVGPQGPAGAAGVTGATGPQGAAGVAAGGVALSTCTRRVHTFQKVNTNADRAPLTNQTAVCNAGEFLHGVPVVYSTYTYSSDWSIDSDTSMTNRTRTYGPFYSGVNKVDNDGFLIGLVDGSIGDVGGQAVDLDSTYGNGEDLADATTLTGSITSTREITLTCCQLGD